MIDKNGNRIIPEKELKDPDFILREIAFFMKAFQRNPDDTRAFSIAKKVTEFLDSGDRIDPVIDTVNKLEEYSLSSDSNDFVWQLVYNRRKFAEKQKDDVAGRKMAAEHRHISAKLFRTIVRINPSMHNRCAEIFELLIASEYYLDAHNQDTADDILAAAQELYEKIEVNDSEIYISAGEALYFNIIKNSRKVDQDEDFRLQTLLRMAHYAREMYLLTHAINSLRIESLAYDYCFECKHFCYEDEKEKINELTSWLIDEISKGKHSLKNFMDSLTKQIKKHQA